MNIVLSHIGHTLMPGVGEAALAAAQAAADAGHRVVVHTHHDWCVFPYLGLSEMRNNAVMEALENRADALCLLDNDVLVPADLLLRFLAHDRVGADLGVGPHEIGAEGGIGVIAPFYETGLADPPLLSAPPHPPGGGLKRLLWVVGSCLWFRRPVFEKIGLEPFGQTLMLSEDVYRCRRWRLSGAAIWQDTDLVVRLLRPPMPATELLAQWRDRLLLDRCPLAEAEGPARAERIGAERIGGVANG